MTRRALLLAAMAALGGPARAGEPPAAAVTIDNFTFAPATLTVAAGTRVTWANRDDIPHTVTSDDPAGPRSPVLDTGESYSLTFDRAGTYGFFCSLHPHMQSRVVVR